MNTTKHLSDKDLFKLTNRYAVFYRKPTPDRWFKDDHKWRAKVRKVIRGPDPVGGIELVYRNLIKGLDEIGANYVTNIPYDEIEPNDLVGVIGNGSACLNDYTKPNRILAGVAVAAHPMEWPELFEQYPVSRYVVHCDWVRKMYEIYYGPRVVNWAVGIDTIEWDVVPEATKTVDFLVYHKIMWDQQRVEAALLAPILSELMDRGLTYEVIRYGSYRPDHYKAALSRARAMIFMCEHETQGLAYQQAMSCNIPILAWDPGMWLDPWRYRYGETYVPATSVPFFDHRCGSTFSGLPEFYTSLVKFLDEKASGKYFPREYVLENLTLAHCAKEYTNLLHLYAA